MDGRPGKPGYPGSPGKDVSIKKGYRANAIIALIVKAKKLLISCCYGNEHFHKRDTEDMETETEEREARDAKCVYYVQYAGGSQCQQYYK